MVEGGKAASFGGSASRNTGAQIFRRIATGPAAGAFADRGPCGGNGSDRHCCSTTPTSALDPK